MRWLAGLLLLLARPAAAQTYVLVVSGIGGDPQYDSTFAAWGSELAASTKSRLGLPDSNVIYLADDTVRAPHANGLATRAEVEARLAALASQAGPNSDVVILLVGHGSDAGDAPQFNLRGPDISADDFKVALSGLRAARVVLVDMSSASGGFVPVLSGPGRVVVTATKSGFERNSTTFPRFFVEALRGEAADADKDGRVSVLEAFQYAKHEVQRAYESDHRLLTEHAQLDDNGDGQGTTDPGPEAPDGALAAEVFLTGTSPVIAAVNDSALAALYARRDSLQRRVTALRARRTSMAPDVYDGQLETLLVDLARVSQSIREREQKPKP